MWTHLSRTGGGIGTRGPGESQLETDRRLIRDRIKKFKERVDQVAEQTADGHSRPRPAADPDRGHRRLHQRRQVDAAQRARRPDVVKAEDRLFATVDPTSRQVKLGDGQTAIVTDTVGFIHKLPHQLVDAFRATLEEVTRADVLLEIVDASDRHFAEHRATVQTVLEDLGAGDKPRLVTFNKADLIEAAARDGDTPAPAIAGQVLISAVTGYGLETLKAELSALLASLWVDVDVSIPYRAGEAAGPRPRAWDGRARLPPVGRSRYRPSQPAAGGRARGSRGPLARIAAHGRRSASRPSDPNLAGFGRSSRLALRRVTEAGYGTLVLMQSRECQWPATTRVGSTWTTPKTAASAEPESGG